MPGKLFFCLFMVLAFSCSRSEPRIPYGFIELVYYPGNQGPVERFSFFIMAEDDDGIDNLNELRIYYERFSLEWIISSQEWVYLNDNDRHWIGSRSIAMTDNSILPRGQYKAVLINKGGEKSERVLTFDAPESPRYPYPGLNIDEHRYRIVSSYPKNFFMIYDQQGNVLGTIPIQNTEGSIEDLELPNNARNLALWAKDEDLKISALTETLPLQ